MSFSLASHDKMSASLPVEASNLPLPPQKPPRVNARHRLVSSGADNANVGMPPPISVKHLSVNPTSQPRLSIESSASSTASLKGTPSSPFTNKEAPPIIKAGSPLTSPVSMHESSKRRDSISSLLSNSSLETYLNEIKQLGRQVKRQLLEDEDIMSLGNRMLPASPQSPPAARRNRAVSLGSSTSTSTDVNDLVRQQQEQLLDSFSKLKQAKQAVTPSSASDANASTPSVPVQEEKKRMETTQDESIPLIEDVKHQVIGERPTIPILFADEKRNHDFHMLFRSVPEEDKLIEGKQTSL